MHFFLGIPRGLFARGDFKEMNTYPMTSQTIPLSWTFGRSCVSIPQKLPKYTNCCAGNLKVS